MQRAFAGLFDEPLGTRIAGTGIRVFDVLDSTNTYALEHGEDGLVIVADRQTAGRGRAGRPWLSAPGLGLWFTVALIGEETRGLTFAAALAVRNVIRDRCNAAIKWPNDILVNGRKVCGILVEHKDGRTALGIGINVHHTRADFPETLREKAGSLQSECGGNWDRAELLRALLRDLDEKIILIRGGGLETLRAEWAAACGLEGKRVRIAGHAGVVKSIDSDGAIVLDTGSGTRRIHSGDLEALSPSQH